MSESFTSIYYSNIFVMVVSELKLCYFKLWVPHIWLISGCNLRNLLAYRPKYLTLILSVGLSLYILIT